MPLSLSCAGYGVSIDIETYYTSRIMIVSMIPFLILQMAKVLNSSSGTRIVVLVALLVTLSFLFVYFTYQVTQNSISVRIVPQRIYIYIYVCVCVCETVMVMLIIYLVNSLTFIFVRCISILITFFLENGRQYWCRYSSHGFRVEDLNTRCVSMFRKTYFRAFSLLVADLA